MLASKHTTARALLAIVLVLTALGPLGVGTAPAATAHSIEITQRGDRGEIVPGGCSSFFYESGATETFVGRVCDGDDPDGVDGVLRFTGASGRYRVVEDVAPTSYRVAEDLVAVVTQGVEVQIDRAHAPLAQLRVVSTDVEDATTVLGSCWQIQHPDQTEGWDAEGCDGDDGVEDGIWTTRELPDGAYVVRHLSSPGYENYKEPTSFQLGPDDSSVNVALHRLRPPVNLTRPTVVGTVAVGSTLFGNAGEWSGSEPLKFSSLWESCDATGGSCSWIPGQSSPTFTPSAAFAGRTFRFVTDAKNEAGYVEAASEVTAPLVVTPTDSRPQSIEPPTITRLLGLFIGGEGHWRSTNGTTTFAYQWMRCDVSGAACVPIDGATSPVMRRIKPATDLSIRLRVDATNASGTTSAMSMPLVLGPERLSAPMLSGSTRVGDVMSASTGLWSGNTGAMSYSYLWLRCNSEGAACISIHGFWTNHKSYRLTSADVGYTIRVQVTATDADAGRSSEDSSASPVVALHPPTSLTPPTIEGEFRVGRWLKATKGTWASDRPITLTTFLWLRCDAQGAGCVSIDGFYTKSARHEVTADDLGHTIRVVVRARNEDGFADSAMSGSPVTVSYYPPIASTAPSITGVPMVGHELSASTGTWASDETPYQYSYLWLRCDPDGNNCIAADGHWVSASTYVLSTDDIGYTIRVRTSAFNSDGNTNSEASPSTPPIVP